jgi:hypothetical protein
MGAIRAGVAFFACTWLLAAERPQAVADARCEAGAPAILSLIGPDRDGTQTTLTMASTPTLTSHMAG